MIPGAKGHVLHARMNHMTLGPAKREKVARIGRISNVFRLTRARSAEKAVGIMETGPNIIIS